MSSQEIFRRGGCALSCSIAFGLGVAVGFFLFWLDDQWTPFIDQPTAASYALDYARDLCGRGVGFRTGVCTHRITSVQESKDGWMFGVLSADRETAALILVSRKGAMEAEGMRVETVSLAKKSITRR
ncbi:hypothetical protein [Sphingomonas sp. PAMC 26621]|uniref:hypothetical protein n=1 Tax=Sphingomonas sp. PAMC 26621 TaxID=1112213 RepID=UPI000289AE5D|nr:hypothetical protein [Sphingomonas sp. PAMC 26621]